MDAECGGKNEWPKPVGEKGEAAAAIIEKENQNVEAGKSEWPELVGKQGEAAAAIIKKENENLEVIVLKDGTPVTKDYRSNRVRVVVDDHGLVIKVPRIG